MDNSDDDIHKLLSLTKEYQVNEKRKIELDHLLDNYQSLVAERDMLNEWLTNHAAIGGALLLTRSKPNLTTKPNPPQAS